MTVLRAQTSGSASSKASGGSQASRIDCRRVSPPRGRKVHALVRGSSQREVLAGQTPQVHCSVNTKRQGGSTAQSKPPIKVKPAQITVAWSLWTPHIHISHPECHLTHLHYDLTVDHPLYTGINWLITFPAFQLSVQGKRQHAAAQEQGYAWVPLVAATTVPLLIAAPAWAAYSPTEGEQALKTVAGAAYIILVCFFFYRLIRKRAYTGVTQVIIFLLLALGQEVIVRLPTWRYWNLQLDIGRNALASKS